MSMDYDFPPQDRQFGDNVIAFNAHEEDDNHQHDDGGGYYDDIQQQQYQGEEGAEIGGSAGIERKQLQQQQNHSRDSSSSAGKLFVGGVSWETTEETFTNYFSKYGEVMDSVIMMDRHSGRPRGFGFVTFADPAVADRVLEEDHVIDGRTVEVKRTVPREDMELKGSVMRTKKIFVGGIPPSLTEDDLKEYFSVYGSILDHQIMLDHKTGRSRGFGFVTFESEDAVERIFSEVKIHELGGKQVEIKKAEPKRSGDFGSAAKPYSGFSNGAGGFGTGHSSAGRYGRKMGRGYGMYGGFDNYNDYGNYGASYAGNTAGFYGAYGGYGYGFGFGGPMMYGTGVYGAGGYGASSGYGGLADYGAGKGYGRSGDGDGFGRFGIGKRYGNGGDSHSSGYGSHSSGYGSGKGYGGSATSGGAVAGRYHPYHRK